MFSFLAASKENGLAIEKLTKIKEIKTQFANMTDRIKRVLISNNVDAVSLNKHLCSISAVKNKKLKVPLFDTGVFEKIKSIDDFWKVIEVFLRVFDYELLWLVVEVSKCGEAQQIFKEFSSNFDPSTIIDMDLELYCEMDHREGSLKPVLRIKVDSKECTTDVKKQVEEIVSTVYNLDKYALCFQGIKEGLLYYVSQPLRTYLLQFELCKRCLEDFRTHKIISLHIDEFELDTMVCSKQCNYSNYSC